jgi:uncharacterized protein
MKIFALHYDYVPDMPVRRDAVRPAHLEHVHAAAQRHELIVSGAYADPADAALLIFAVEDRAVVEAFAKADPYAAAGLIVSWRVREWSVGIGRAALEQLKTGGAAS